MRIPAGLLAQVVEHARREAPNECCGLLATVGDRVVEVHPTENAAASPLRFEIGPRELLDLTIRIEDAGHDTVIYHSHTRSAPYPSQTDINFAALWPGVEWLIVGLASGADPEVRIYRIEDGVVSEADLEVDGG